MNKKDLENEIDRLKAQIRERDRLLADLTADQGMEVELPFAKHAGKHGDAHYGRSAKFGDDVLPVVADVVAKHGVLISLPTASSVRLGKNSHSSGKRYVIPRVVGLMLVDFLDAVGTFSRKAYSDGFSDGSDLLCKLTAGEITADEFDESRERERARATQDANAYKQFGAEERKTKRLYDEERSKSRKLNSSIERT